ncbi:MAG: antitoxin [Desulfobacterales bacterium CG23_combo_of_CG06-09_8_20_14_all_51_8]|nr:MAG: antitoxin [Desulfobacterales bacterium CG23_combo_of_CG06-09_8_20_14_all_51_8]
MKDEIKKLLFDINEAADSIFEYLGEKRDFNIYAKNKMMRRAVEREFEIIGEAMNAILKIEPNIPVKNARRIVALRNQVIHILD